MQRDGGLGEGSIKWTSSYGSVISSFYNIATVEGMNEAGLVANTLYLVESDYGDAKASGKPLICRWAPGRNMCSTTSKPSTRRSGL